MTFAQRRNRLTTHFSEGIPVVKRRMSVILSKIIPTVYKCNNNNNNNNKYMMECVFHHRGADKSLARFTSRCIFFDGENISFESSLVMYINSTNIPPIVIINRIYETQNLLSL